MKILPLIALLFSASIFADDDCKKEEAKKSVEWACEKISSLSADAAKAEIQKYRFCGSNYVWVQDADVKMVLHPIKVRLNGSDLKGNKDEKGKHLFVEFDKTAKANKDGGWVDYYWAKPGAQEATPKVSFVKLCSGDKKWIAGSGVWK